jgi:excisionase family DNA binding protein
MGERTRETETTVGSDDTENTPEFMTVKEVARLLRVGESTVSRLLNEGKLPGIYTGNRQGWRIRRQDVMNWTTNQPQNDHGINQTSSTGHGEER